MWANKRFLITVFCLGLTAPAWAAVEVVGTYSNRIVADKQARGYGIQLWREGSTYFGFLFSTNGLAEEMPMGVLEDVRFDPNDHSLSFKARLSVDRATLNGETWVPTRDVFQFQGTLFPDQITGHLIHADALQPDRAPIPEDVKLYRAHEEEQAMPTPSTYEAWSRLAQKLLAANGPKW